MLKFVILIAILVALYYIRPSWFEPVAEVIDDGWNWVSKKASTSESFYNYDREKDSLGISHTITEATLAVPKC